MDRTTIMIIIAAAMSAVGIVGDYFLKRASGEAWKAQIEGSAAKVFRPGGGAVSAVPAADIKALHAKIGESTLENDS